VPGSPSSELHTTYFAPGKARGMNDHFSRSGSRRAAPRRADFFRSAMMSSGLIFSLMIFFSAA